MKSALSYLYTTTKTVQEERSQKREWRKTYDPSYQPRRSMFMGGRNSRKSVFGGLEREGNGEGSGEGSGEGFGDERGRRFTIAGASAGSGSGSGSRSRMGTGMGTGSERYELDGHSISSTANPEPKKSRNPIANNKQTNQETVDGAQHPKRKEVGSYMDFEGNEEKEKERERERWRKSVISMFQPVLKRGNF